LNQAASFPILERMNTATHPASTWLSNQFLISMPALRDPNFEHTITLICEHNKEGALGFVLNRPTDVHLGELFESMDIHGRSLDVIEQPVFSGGPVHADRGFVVHSPTGQWQSTMKISDSLAVTASRDILEAMATGEGPAQAIVLLGYAGWGGGQLEQEMLDNSWITTPVDNTILFDTQNLERWKQSASQIGIDLDRMSMQAGHA
jgi:putative transcriptional regulator